MGLPYNTRVIGKPRTKALKADQLKGELLGDLAIYEQVGLYQRNVNKNTAYRYRGALLRYQEFLAGNPPSLAASIEYLTTLRKNEFDPATLRVYRAALSGYHEWKGEELKFKVKEPETSAKYIPWEKVQEMMELAASKPHDELILRLMGDGGLRRDEVVNLKIGNVEGDCLRFRGKGSKERTVPMTEKLKKLVDQFSAGRPKDASLVELGEKGVYMLVKRYGALVNMPEITPHDLRRAFATHLNNITGNIRIVQEILGHSNVNTTQAYTAVTLNNMQEAIHRLNGTPSEGKKAPEQPASGEKVLTFLGTPYTDSPHKLKIREVARLLADKITLPSIWEEDTRYGLPVEFKPGEYRMPFGTIKIDRNKKIKVAFPDTGTGIAEPHLVEALYSHLGTSGTPKFQELAGDNGKLKAWTTAVEQNSLVQLKFLKLIANDVAKHSGEISFLDELKPGPTEWFILTAWRDALQVAEGYNWIDDTWYQPHESIPGTGLWRLKCGAYIIGIAADRETLKTYETRHKELREKYAEHPSAKDIGTNNKSLINLAQEIKQRLLEFSDLEHLPGRCGLC